MSQSQAKLVYSLSHNPWYNLALEEYMLNNVCQDEIILYLWQNQNTVVIGRNQNAWKECRCKQLEKDGGRLARRLSGGGAVFHDLGNLNFTFIMDRNLYNLKKQLGVILEAVKSLGIDAEFTGRNDLTVNGKKFSGNAFHFKSRSAYHHGTLLVNSDLVKLAYYLQVSRDKIEAKGVESVRSRVVNLGDINPELSIEELEKSMKESFIKIYGQLSTEEEINPGDVTDVQELYEKYSSWKWRYGHTPDFDITFKERFSWGDIELGLQLNKGIVESAVIYSDAMNADLIEKIADVLEGTAFCMSDILNNISSISDDIEDSTIIEDMIDWLQTKSI